MSEQTEAGSGGWQPRITAFVCRWCTYAGADLAGTSRLKYPPHIRIVKLPCTGRIDTLFILRAFAMGSDGVLVSGCHPGDCHYTSGNYIARRRFTMFRELCNFVGLQPERLHFSWVSAAEGAKFVDVVTKVTEAVRSVGPFPGFMPSAAGEDGNRSMVKDGNRFPTIDLRSAPIADASSMKADLESGVVKAILGTRPGRRDGSLHPVWVRQAATLDALRHSEDRKASLVTYLVRRLREDPQGSYGIVAGAKDLGALGCLEAEQQIDPARIKVYAQAGAAGEPAAGTLAAASGKREAWEAYAVPGMDRPARERWNFWTAQFARCIRCYACREDCAMCSCVRCVADKTRPRWIDSSSTPAGNWLWNMNRAFHLAGRCVECGGCTEACPVGIPLGALGMHLNRLAERDFGPRPEGEKGKRSPLVMFTIEDEAPFIL
jgi:F420-non-reducing hydrogenase iron-sulfur subunit